MSLIDEFRFYCKSPCPTGALLLTGEWGSGKTYFIDNVLSQELQDGFVFIRISLFGLESIKELKKDIVKKYIECLSGIPFSAKSIKAFRNAKSVISELPLPGLIKKIFSIDFLELITIKPTVGEKKLVLVFDDLERTLIPYVDVLGCINDYCENNKIHTIIVANEEKIHDIAFVKKEQKDILQYYEIKEKIVRLTLKYSPNYRNIVTEIIDGYSTCNTKYKTFLDKITNRLVDFFSCEYVESRNDLKTLNKMPINLRVFKASLYDFERIFPLLDFDNSIDELFKWLSTFLCFELYWKSGRLMGEKNGSDDWEQEIKEIFGTWYDKRYSLRSVQCWMSEGEWNEQAIVDEIKVLQERNTNQLPDAIVRIDDLCFIDDSVMEKGFPIVLKKAYAGDLTLNDYVSIIEKSIDARKIQYLFPNRIDWEQICNGINLCIQRMFLNNESDTQNKHMLSDKNLALLNQEERDAYDLIERCRVGGHLGYEATKRDVIKQLEIDPIATLRKYNKFKFYAFHNDIMTEMLSCYLKLNNNDKCFFELEFNNWWRDCCMGEGFNKSESINNFQEMFNVLKRKEYECLQNGRKLESINIERFSEEINGIIQLLVAPGQWDSGA